MCGIAGLFSKSSTVEESLGAHLSAMLGQLADRGPDSAGVALYRDPAPAGSCKVSLFSPESDYPWPELAWEMAGSFGAVGEAEVRRHPRAADRRGRRRARCRHWLAERHPELRVMSVGERIEIYKEAGDPREFIERFGLAEVSATHALGHTRMATESRVTTEHSHPFSTGLDLCLVHNGSLSNHNRLRGLPAPRGHRLPDRQRLRGRRRLPDLAACARATTSRRRSRAASTDLDGFYTFAVGTADGFAVLRDPIACKPAVMAETDDWVAMASEYRAIATLPGAEDAEPGSPSPGASTHWERARVA